MTLAALFLSVSVAYNLPPRLLDSLCWVESAHNVKAIRAKDGIGASYGVCQIKLDTARSLGFKGTAKELMKPGVNINYAGKYLRSQINRYSGSMVRGICAYNRGKSTGDGYSSYTRKVLNTYLRREQL